VRVVARMRRLVLPVLYAVAVGAVAWSALAAGSRVGALSVTWAPAPLLLALGVLALQIATLTCVWALLLRAAARSIRPSPWLAIRSFGLGWLIRYLPGVPASSAGRYVVCREAGYPTAAIAAALFYETLLQSGAAALLPAALLSFGLGGRWLWLTPFAVVAVCGLTALAVAPPVVVRLARRLRRAGMVSAEGFRPVPLAALAAPFLGAVLATLLAALAFHLIAVAATPLTGRDLGRNLFAYGLAGWLGFVVPLLPSGVGVREAVLVALLGPQIGHSDALGLAVLARAVPVLFDAAFGAALALASLAGALRLGAAGALVRRLRRSGRTPPRPTPTSAPPAAP
jgi:hypothetical protein